MISSLYHHDCREILQLHLHGDTAMETVLFFHFLLFINRTKRNTYTRMCDMLVCYSEWKNTDSSTDAHCVARN